MSRAQLGQMLAVNLMAPFFLTQGVLPCLRAAGDACVVNITDMAVDKPYGPAQHMSHYLTAKAGLAALTRAWATELAPSVRVNAVAPGPVAVSADTTPEDRERLWRTVPLGREGSPDDVARAVVFFATGAPYVTGQTLRVDGGLSAC